MCILHSELCEHLQIVRFAVLKSAVNGTTLIDSYVLYPIVWGGVCGMVYMCLRPIKIGGVKFQQYNTFPIISLAVFLRLDLRSILIVEGNLLPQQLVCHKSLISIVSCETRL